MSAAAADHRREGHLEAGFPLSTEEKRIGTQIPGAKDYNTALQSTKKKMTCRRRLLMILIVGLVFCLGVASARPSFIHCGRKHQEAKQEVTKVLDTDSDLSKEIKMSSPDVLHRLLHAYLPERFQHGVFASDKEAIEKIHGDNPSVASAIIKIAKRQDDTNTGNSSIATTTTSSSSSSVSLPTTTTDSTSSTSSSESTSTTPSSTTESSSTSVPPTSTSESSTSAPPSSDTTTTTSEASTSSTPSQTTTSGTSTTEATTSSESSSSSSAPVSSSAPASTSASGRLSTSSESSLTSNAITSSETPSSSSSPLLTSSQPTTATTAPSSATTPTSTSTTSAQKTITQGTKTTSTPVAQTFTHTLPNGGTTTLTSTSWVAVVPTGDSEAASSPGLQNAGSYARATMAIPAAIGMMVGAAFLA